MSSPSVALRAHQDTPDISADYETTFRYPGLLIGALRLMAGPSCPQDTSLFRHEMRIIISNDLM
jgi:hypothetical protein